MAARTICRGCGDMKALEGHPLCASCLAQTTNNVIPVSPGGDILDHEYESILREAKARMELGRAHYENSFNRADLKTDMVEEILDLINYGVFMIARIRRVLADFEGPVSKVARLG